MNFTKKELSNDVKIIKIDLVELIKKLSIAVNFTRKELSNDVKIIKIELVELIQKL